MVDMSDIGLAMAGNDLGFLWDDQPNQFSWANLSTENSEEDKSVGRNQISPSDGGQNGNYKKGRRAAAEGPTSNRKRGKGAVCKKKNSNVIAANNNNNNNSSDVGGDDKKVGDSDHEIHIWTERERRKKMRNMFANLHALLPQLPSKADKSTIVDEAVNYIKALEETFHELKKRKLEKLQGANASTSTSTTNSPRGFTSSSPPSIQQLNKLLPSLNNCNNYDAATVTREAFLADQLGSTVNDYSHYHSTATTFQTWTSSNVVLNVSGHDAHISVCSPKKPGLLSSIVYALEKNKLGLVSAQISSDGVRNMYMIHARANIGVSDQIVEGLHSVEEVFKRAVGEIMFWISS